MSTVIRKDLRVSITAKYKGRQQEGERAHAFEDGGSLQMTDSGGARMVKVKNRDAARCPEQTDKWDKP